MDDCFKMLENEVRVAMVFKEVPENFMGRKVINGDLYDMRYKDPKDVIIGLKFKQTREKLNETYSFVIQ